MGLFGTDGIRGVVMDAVFSPQSLIKIASAATRVLSGESRKVVIGGDTRFSYDMIATSLATGFMTEGFDVIHVGVVPTPAVAHITKALRADFGVVISASHNPAQDNGIKFFSQNGDKITPADEQAIEAAYGGEFSSLPGLKLGRLFFERAAVALYENHLYNLFSNLNLTGKIVALDCAHGALFSLAPKVFQQLGAEVRAIGNSPDGHNINNNCGSTHPEVLKKWVVEQKADIGFAFDGDGDRIVVVTGQGDILDGDQLLAIIAQRWLGQGRLDPRTVVGTVMANRGLKRFLENHNIQLEKSAVGDRWVTEKMTDIGALIGGESSGHIILKPLSLTGDGLLVALELVAAYCHQPFARAFLPDPQILRNVKGADKSLLTTKLWRDFIVDIEARHSANCDILIRPSGTEPVIRVMVQGKDRGQIEGVCDEICGFLQHGAVAQSKS